MSAGKELDILSPSPSNVTLVPVYMCLNSSYFENKLDSKILYSNNKL